MAGALEGVRAIEIAQYVGAPYAGGLLADLGAEVIKIEAPPHGDPYRAWTSGNYSATFTSLNRGKKSIVLDLRSKEGLEVALALAKTSDVLIENARPGVMDRLGLGYQALSALNPRLVYCSVTGFGPDGPYVKRPGYDTVGQAMSGLLSLLTDMADPQPMGTSLSDHIAGLYAVYAILAGLMAREKTGRGQHVQTSLLESSLSFLSENVARYLDERGPPPTRETRVRTAGVFAFVAGDGLPFVLHLSSPDKFWQGLARAIGRPELGEDPRFARRTERLRNREAMEATLKEVFATDTREHWLRRLQEEDVPAAALYNLDETVQYPQVRHLGIIQEVVHPAMGPMRIVGSGIRMSETPTRVSAAPALGEHTPELLAQLGFPADWLD